MKMPLAFAGKSRLTARAFVLAALALIAILCSLPAAAVARSSHAPAAPLYISFIDQTSPQVTGPVFNGIDERRRGPIFNAALQQVVRDGKLPAVVVINKDLSLPSNIVDEPKVPAGATLVRIYLTQWSQTRLGGIADTEILCRFFVDVVHDGRVIKKMGPFFDRRTYNPVVVARPEDRWAQYQAAARQAIGEMAVAFAKNGLG